MLESLTKNDQLEKEIPDMSGIKMLIFSIIPNLATIKNQIYTSILEKFFTDHDCAIYGKESFKFGFIFADVSLPIVNELLERSTFIFKVNLIPDGIAQEIRRSGKTTPINSATAIPNPYLPKVVLMDSGVNNLPSLSPVLHKRDAYVFQNHDDEHNGDGHGTPIANLIAFGEGNEPASANIISYKIWSSQEGKHAMCGMIHGIDKYADQTRLFVTSIGIPQMPPHIMVRLDKTIQNKNICLVASAGNIDPTYIQACLKQGSQYPDYIRGFPVTPPATIPDVVAVGSVAKWTHKTLDSLAPAGGVSPYSRCGAGAYDLFECKKPQLVEHGGNVNIIDRDFNLNFDDVGVRTINKFGQPVSMFGSSVSSPLFVRKLAALERVYRDRISNIETMLAISYLSCKNGSACSGYGEASEFTHTGTNSAVYLAEGAIGFTQVSENEMSTPKNEIVIYVPPGVDEIRLCLVHSDDFKKSVAPTLETYFDITAHKMGNRSAIDPVDPDDATRKTNVKIASYKFESKSMESMWTFSIRPRTTNKMLTVDKRAITVRYGCAILLARRADKRSPKPLTLEITEKKEKFST